VNEIPGVRTQQLLLAKQGVPVWEQSAPPSFTLPARALTVELRGRQAGTPEPENIHVFGEGIVMAIDGIQVADGDVDSVRISKSGRTLGYRSADGSEGQPVFSFGVNGPDVSYDVELTPSGLAGGDWSTFTILPATNQLVVRAGTTSAVTYSGTVRRVTDAGEREIELPPIEIGAGQSVTIDYRRIA
jgi:hypothetical protein